MKKIMSFGLIALFLQFGLVGQTFANSHDEKVKTEIAKLGTGPDARLKITLNDKTKIEGYVVNADENQFVLMNARTGQPVPVPYSAVNKAKGHNLSTGAIVVIGVVGVLVLLFVLIAHST